MDFALSDEERAIRDTVRTFVTREVMPLEAEVLRRERAHQPGLDRSELRLGEALELRRQALDGLFQHVLICLAQSGTGPQRRRRQMRIEPATHLLPRMCGFHPCTYRGTGLTQRRAFP